MPFTPGNALEVGWRSAVSGQEARACGDTSVCEIASQAAHLKGSGGKAMHKQAAYLSRFVNERLGTTHYRLYARRSGLLGCTNRWDHGLVCDRGYVRACCWLLKGIFVPACPPPFSRRRNVPS